MMRHALTLLTSLVAMSALAFGLSQGRSNVPDEQVEQELRNLVRAWDEAEVKGDTVTLDRLLADEFSYVGGPAKSEYLAFVKAKSPETYVESAVSTGVEVKVYGDFAVVTGLDTVKGKNKGQAYVSRWLYMDAWVKRAGRWQCVKTHSALQASRTP